MNNKHNADINALPEKALRLAAEKGDLAMVNDCLAKGANKDAQYQNGLTALMLAAEKGHKAVVAALLSAGADMEAKAFWDDDTALLLAAQNGHAEVVDILLGAGADINARKQGDITALMLAAEKGHEEVVSLLLKASAHINSQTRGGFTALMLAARNGHAEIVSSLRKADAYIGNSIYPGYKRSGGTALMIAAEMGHAEVVAVLLSTGVDIEAENPKGYTALMLAARNGHAEIVSALLNAHANIYYTYNKFFNKHGNETALMFAAENGHAEIVSSLLNAGTKRAIQEKGGGFRALRLAARNGHKEVASLLLTWFFQNELHYHVQFTHENIDDLGCNGLALIIRAIPPQVRSLNLAGGKLARLGVDGLAQVLHAIPPHVMTLDLRGNQLFVKKSRQQIDTFLIAARITNPNRNIDFSRNGESDIARAIVPLYGRSSARSVDEVLANNDYKLNILSFLVSETLDFDLSEWLNKTTIYMAENIPKQRRDKEEARQREAMQREAMQRDRLFSSNSNASVGQGTTNDNKKRSSTDMNPDESHDKAARVMLG